MRYRDAGVDLEAHRRMHSVASRLLSGESGAYTRWIELRGADVTIHVDGVGTKTLVLEKLGKLEVAGWDCVVMNTNDVACDGFKPIAVVDYIAMPSSDERAFVEVLKGIHRAAVEHSIVVLGGETAILPGLANGIDVVCTILAIREARVHNRARHGDVIVGLESNGLHANGFSLVRKLIEEKLGGRYDTIVEGIDLSVELAKPTRSYTRFLLEAWSRNLIHAAAHITGGAYTKLGRILPEKTCAKLTMPRSPPIFELLLKLGVPVDEAYRVFNMGFGLIVATDAERLDDVISLAERLGIGAHVLGRIEECEERSVVINTPYSDKPIVYLV